MLPEATYAKVRLLTIVLSDLAPTIAIDDEVDGAIGLGLPTSIVSILRAVARLEQGAGQKGASTL